MNPAAYCSSFAFEIVFWTIAMPSMYRSTQLPRHDWSRDDNDVPGFCMHLHEPRQTIHFTGTMGRTPPALRLGGQAAHAPFEAFIPQPFD